MCVCAHAHTRKKRSLWFLFFQLPVPMLIPSSVDNEDKATESIEDIKEKLPTHPFEADLLEMAEMIAEDEEKEKSLSQGGWCCL